MSFDYTRTPEISVIVPSYNAERTIRQCIDSILLQTLTDFELICINDGSTDRTPEILDQLESVDTRIRVIHTKNCGVSEARNLGVRNSSSELLCFVDADDILKPSYLRNFLTCQPADLILQGIYLSKHQRISVWQQFPDLPATPCEHCLSESILNFTGPYSKLFRKSIIQTHGILFPSGIQYGEDAIFYYQYLLHARTISSTSSIGYIYHANVQNSLTAKAYVNLNDYLRVVGMKRKLIERINLRFALKCPHSYRMPRAAFYSLLAQQYRQGGSSAVRATLSQASTEPSFAYLLPGITLLCHPSNKLILFIYIHILSLFISIYLSYKRLT